MKNRLLFVHIPKTAGVYIAEYLTEFLGYSRFLSEKTSEDGVWLDYTLDELMAFIDEDTALIHTHLLSYGWFDLAHMIPQLTKEEIVSTIKQFKQHGWFSFAFVRHPGEILCSFYHYVYDFHHEGKPHIVAAHAPVVDQTIDQFVSDHCQKELLPSYWMEFDFIAEASDETIAGFFKHYFNHAFVTGKTDAHASGNRGYDTYCREGLISEATQKKVEVSDNMRIYTAIVSNRALE